MSVQVADALMAVFGYTKVGVIKESSFDLTPEELAAALCKAGLFESFDSVAVSALTSRGGQMSARSIRVTVRSVIEDETV